MNLLGRSLLFALLVVDWAADPSMGRSPTSRALASQEVVPRALALKKEISNRLSQLRELSPQPMDVLAQDEPVVPEPAPPHSLLRDTPLIYVVMVILR